MDGLRLDGRVALVTGAARGIGKGVAIGFAARGARVMLTGRQPVDCPPPALGEAQAVGEAAYTRFDVTDRDAAQQAVQQVLTRWGRLDIVVANAGIYPKVPFEQMTPEDWDQMQAVNLTGHFNTVWAATPTLVDQGYGKIITVSSINADIVQAERAHYVATKMGIIGFTRGLARDLGKYGIRANCILPGAVLTEGELEAFPDQSAVLQEVNELQCIPGRIGPADIEPTFAFLASEASDAITGQTLTVDLGWSFN